MGSALLVSMKLHRHHRLVRHACAYVYPCRRNLLTSTSVNEREKGLDLEREVSLSLNEREREGIKKREAADSYVVQYNCVGTKNGFYKVSGRYYCLLSSKNWAQAPLRIFRIPQNSDHPNRWYHVNGACDGLLHFADEDKSEKGGIDLLWMPSTNQFKILAPSKVPRLPHASQIHYGSIGLGFDSKSQDYKVVRLVYHFFGEEPDRNQIPHMQAELYSLKTDSWKEILEVPLSQDSRYYCSRAHVNGRYYWRFVCSDPEVAISSFDFTTEKFSCLALPPQARANWQRCQLVEVDGKLGCFMYRSSNYGMQSVELWVLEEADGRRSYSWARSDFEINDLAGAKDPMMYDSDAGLLFIRGVDMGLMVYDIHTGKLEKLMTTNQSISHVSRYVVHPISPPLISS